MILISTRQKGLLSIREITPDNERDLLLPQLLDSDLERIRLALKIDQNRCVHADLKRPCAEDSRSLVLGHKRCCRPLVHRDLLILARFLGTLSGGGSRCGVTRHDYVFVLSVLIVFLTLLLVVVVLLGIIVILDLIILEGGLVSANRVSWRVGRELGAISYPKSPASLSS